MTLLCGYLCGLVHIVLECIGVVADPYYRYALEDLRDLDHPTVFALLLLLGCLTTVGVGLVLAFIYLHDDDEGSAVVDKVRATLGTGRVDDFILPGLNDIGLDVNLFGEEIADVLLVLLDPLLHELVPFLQATEVDTDAVLVEHIRLSAAGAFALGEMVFIREGVFLAVERFGDTVGGELLTVLFIGAFTAAAGM